MSESCVACGSADLLRYPARVAPFLAGRVPGLASARAELARCRACGLAFYLPRLADAELAAVYRGYRDDDYQRERQRHEPGYTPERNAAVGKGAPEVTNRNANVEQTLARHLDLAAVRSVLDYGGDHGQFIPPGLGAARRVVYEISGVPAHDGAVAVANWEEAARERYDVVLCNHVLEHVPYPARLVEQVLGVAHPGSWLYFEVPFEWPFRVDPGAGWKQRAYQAGLRSQALAQPVLRPDRPLPLPPARAREPVLRGGPAGAARAVRSRRWPRSASGRSTWGGRGFGRGLRAGATGRRISPGCPESFTLSTRKTYKTPS